jgi:hypothetical protein
MKSDLPALMEAKVSLLTAVARRSKTDEAIPLILEVIQ